MSSTTPDSSQSSSKTSATSPGDRAAEKQRAKEQAVERRQQRDEKWMEKRLAEIGKSEALKNINTNWQSYTPFEMSLLLNMEEVIQAVEARIMRIASIFESFRNMLIIVPIMLTWLSLAIAGSSYEQNLSAKNPNSKPFLQQWQEGFSPLASVHLWRWDIALVSHGIRWFTFAGFALTDAALLAIILTTTVIGQALEAWAYQRGARIAAVLEQHIYSLNAQALYHAMSGAPDAKTPPWLRELRTDLAHLGDVIDKMNTALDTSMEQYTEAITQQKRAVSALVTDTNKIHDSVVNLNTLFQGGAEAAQVYRRYIPGVTKDFANLVNTQQRSMRSMEHMVDMLSKSMLYLGEVTNNVRDARTAMDRYQEFAMSTGGRPPVQPRRGSSRTAPPLSALDATPDNLSDVEGEDWADMPSTDESIASGQPGDMSTPGKPAAHNPRTSPPPVGFWRRMRYRLSRIPVIRVFVRRRP